MADYEIFRAQLSTAYPTYGYPLWSPPRPDRPVEIGDVGFLCSGEFHRLFNVLLTSDDERQQFGVPEHYERLVLAPSLVDRHITESSLSRGHYCSAGVSVEPQWKPSSSSPDDDEQISFVCPEKRTGAVSYLATDARRKNTLAKRDFGRWMLKHIDRWLPFARGLGLEIEQMEDIILVTGCDLTKSWINVAFLGNQVDARVSFRVEVNGHDASIKLRHSPKDVRGAVLNKGPEGEDLPEDQTIFIRGFRVARTLGIWPKHLKAAAGPSPDSEGYDHEPDRVPISMPAVTTQRDPLHLAKDFIAEQASDCDMVLIHDDDLGTIVGIDNSTSLGILQSDVMTYLRRSNIEIHKVFYEDLSPISHSLNTDADGVRVAMLSSTFQSWNTALQSQLSPLVVQNISHGGTSKPSQSPPLILPDSSPASASRNDIGSHKALTIEDHVVNMPGQSPSRMHEVAFTRRDMSHSYTGASRQIREYIRRSALSPHMKGHTVAQLGVPPPLFPDPDEADQSPTSGQYSWDNRQRDNRQHYPRLDGISHSSLEAGHGLPFSPVPISSLRHEGTEHDAPSQLALAPRPAFPLPPSLQPNIPDFSIPYRTNHTSAEPYPQLPGLQLPFGVPNKFSGPQIPVPQPFSLCTGKRRALIIGIDYTSHPDPDFRLKWCAEDAFTMANFLCDKLGFKDDDIRIITDTNPWDFPTKENILDAMRALVRDANPHDSFFLYFSGHGTEVKDMNGDRWRGVDQCICAVDWRGNGVPPYEDTPGLIIDGVIHEILVKPLPLQCRLTAVFDARHSGTVLDLPYVYSSQGVVKEIKHDNKLGLLREKASYADVVSLSVSKDSRGTKETRTGGALRLAFINCLTSFEYNVTYKELIKSVRGYMRDNRWKQKPVLSSSHEIDTDCHFIV